MRSIVEGMRSVLIAGGMSGGSIYTTWPRRVVEYPCVVIGVVGGRGGGVGILRLRVSVWSKASKGEGMGIYDTAHGYLDGHPEDFAVSGVSIHRCEAVSIGEGYDIRSESWEIWGEYEIEYSGSDSGIFSVVGGSIYASSGVVEAVGSMLVGEFSGDIQFGVSYESIVRGEQQRFGGMRYFSKGTGFIEVRGVYLSFDIYNKLWGIVGVSGYLSDGVTSGLSYTIRQSSKPVSLQVLIKGTRSSDNKVVEFRANNSYCMSIAPVLGDKSLASYPLRFECQGDSEGNIMMISEEV